MTTITAGRVVGHATRPLEGLIARLGRTWSQWLLYRRTLEELERLSDRDLADLGISRWDIPEIARESAQNA